jgi:uncharacterized protein YjbJ (UPF0337 family)
LCTFFATFGRCGNRTVKGGVAAQHTEANMDWNRVEGNWKQKWGKLTDDDLNVINGKRDQLEGKIQERYGYAKDQTKKDIDDWYNAQKW